MRTDGWEKRFSDYLASRQNMPFEWGVNDCILFAAKGYEVITGTEYYSKFLPYSTEEEAKEIIEKNGGFYSLISKDIGRGHRNILKARRGDGVLLKLPNFTCGLVDDSGESIAVPGKQGLVRYPLSKAWRIWSIE